MVVGVAGKYCSGKSTVAEILEESGFIHIDVDKLGHGALARRKDTIVERFGNEILTPETGDIDRRRLGRLVFSDVDRLRALEEIVHPEMRRMTNETIEANPRRDIVINAAILFPMGLDELCDGVFWVTAPLLQRLCRARARDRHSLGQLMRRFRAQRALSPQQSRHEVDIVTVRNASNKESLRRRVLEGLSCFGSPS